MTPAWPTPDSFPSLDANDVHIWKIDLTASRPIHLSPDEQERADRLKLEEPRRQFTNARSALRNLLGNYLNAPSERIEFTYAEHGKPVLKRDNSGIRFNVTHSHNLALIAIAADKSVGIDIEWLGRTADTNALSKRFYSKIEQTQLNAISAEQHHQAFLSCWTQKEAYLKAHGSGLSRDTRTFSVSLEGGLLTDDLHGSAQHQWRIESIEPDPGYVAAIAIENRAPNIRQFEK